MLAVVSAVLLAGCPTSLVLGAAALGPAARRRFAPIPAPVGRS